MKKQNSVNVINEIKQNRDHSWFEEVKNRALNDHIDKVAFAYRGKKVTYKEFIEECETKWAPAFRQNGITKNTRLTVCVSSTPELVYLIGAASIVGAQINVVSSEFDSDFLYEIINKSTSDYIFVGEDNLNEMMPTLEKIEAEGKKHIVPIPMYYSLENGNPFESITSKFEKYDKKKYNENLNKLNSKVSLDEFLQKGKEFKGNVYNKSGLNDKFTISYSSGTTDAKRPKGIIHRNMHYTLIGRYHDSEISGLPKLNDSITLSSIPTQSNSYISSVISDTLMEGACIALEPIISNDFFLFSLMINNPSMAIASISTWIYIAKQYYKLSNEERKKIIFPNLILPVGAGEPFGQGEEKFLNQFCKDTKCGIKRTKLPTSITKFSFCGGSCELGSLFTVVFRVYANLRKRDKSVKEPIGLGTYDFVEVKALREDGTYCEPNEYGKLVINSECTMVGYDGDEEKTKAFFITDAYGKKWGNYGCHGFIDKDNNIYIKGRIDQNKSIVPEFLINDEVQKDTKNILSSCVVYTEDDNYVVYIEKQLDCKKKNKDIYKGIASRLKRKFGEEILNYVYIKLVDHENSFPLTHCSKRDVNTLRSKGVTDDCIYLPEVLSKSGNKKSL